MEVVTNIELCAFQFTNGQVLAKGAGSDVLPRLHGPPGVVPCTIDVNCLIGSTMMLLADDDIAFQPKFCDPHGLVSGKFEYASPLGAAISLEETFLSKIYTDQNHLIYLYTHSIVQPVPVVQRQTRSP